MELLQDRAYPFSVPTFACFHFGEKKTTVLELIRRSVLYLKTMAALPVVFAKIFVIYIANLRANREIWNQSTPKGKRQLLTRHQVFLSLLFTVRDSLRGRRSKGIEKGIWARDAPDIPIPFPFECLPSRLCSLYRHEHKVRTAVPRRVHELL